MASLRLIACLALASCYDVPRPECGFQCSSAGECPSGYTCVEDRCRLDTDRPFSCPAIVDASLQEMIPPKILSRSPTPGETNVDLDTVVLVTFDEGVTGVDASTFGLSTDTGFVMGVVTVASIGRAFRFTPDRPLRVGKTYEVVLGTAIRDLAGNPLEETRWTFTTIPDTTGPQIVAMSFGTEGVDLVDALTVMFDEEITGVTSSSVRLEQAGTPVPSTLVLFPEFPRQFRLEHDPFLPQTTYSLIITSDIEDLQGNAFVGTTLTFTTGR
ncbi:MAG: Ig-like domain-containing protein [Kofleriaceae bacterium]